MLSLLRTEWLKIRNYPGFWWVTGLTLLSYPGINSLFYFIYKQQVNSKEMAGQVVQMLVGNPFAFPEVFRTVAYTSSVFIFIPAILIIMLISNEFTFKTHRQNIIDGWSRGEFLLAKFFNVVIITLLVTALNAAVTLVIGYLNKEAGTEPYWKLAHYTALFGLQVFSQLSFAFLLGLLIRRAFIALGVFIFYMMILEQIAMGLLKQFARDAGRFLPLEVSDRITPVPAFLGRLNEKVYEKSLQLVNEHVWYTLLYTGVFWLLCLWIYKKRDL
ncbi:MAG TPA: ABC transporter permease subunit [Lacibacter sp.]|nr:ABC transporter permease subunit [Lacibacter sp.]HMO88828.1 ABC transporter permease subunit [Lacibacter sp.]HMP85866.1 ABC transporter permease subunit [Lacibacter sp.]